MQELSCPCPTARAAQGTVTPNILPPSPCGATPHPALLVACSPARLCSHVPAQGHAALPMSPFLLSPAQQVPCNPMGKPGNPCLDRVRIWPPMPGWEMLSHGGFCLLLLLASPSDQPPTAVRAAHAFLSSCGWRGFSACSEQKLRTGRSQDTRQATPDQIPFLASQKS